MADYHSPTVVSPPIPAADMTALARLLLARIFDETVEEQHSYFHSWCGRCETFSVDAGELSEAWDASHDCDSPISAYVQRCLEDHAAIPDHDRPDDIDLDLTGQDVDWTIILQGIVRRSDVLDELVVSTSFTCTKMRPDGFGGSIMRITDNAVQYASTVEMLENMRNVPCARPITGDEHAVRRRIEAIAEMSGWDSFTLLLLISRWLDQSTQTEALIEYLDRLAGDEDH